MSLLKRVTVVAAAVAALTLAVAAPASAHVTVSSASAVQGGFAVLNFRVPNESDSASTTKLEVNLPIKEAPVASVSLRPVPGWTAVAEKAKLDTPIEAHGAQITEAVSKITWTASADAAIKPGQFQQFEVSVGPLPKVDQMVFKTLQTYSDGNVVRWIDEPATDGTEPESPAPTLKLAAAAATTDAAGTAPPVTETPVEEVSDNTGLLLGGGGLALGALALIVALLAYRRSGSSAAGSSAPESRETVSAGKTS